MQVSDHQQVWKAVAHQLRDQLTEAVWYSTFEGVVPLEANGQYLRISVPSNHVRDRILTRYLPLVTEALHDVVAPGCELDIVVADPSPDDQSPDQASPAPPQPGSPEEPRRERPSFHVVSSLSTGPDGSSLLDEAGLNPRYTFETFVKGASNQFALAAALRVAETPARSYNPLFIYGAAGLGKTHLLHAIGHYVHHNYQHHEVRYVSTETFLNEFVDAIRTNTGNAFKRRYREIDVLLIDDIQFLENREGLQEEFFHTFNSLHGANKQIVISSDRVPDAIPTLEERLRGRFK